MFMDNVNVLRTGFYAPVFSLTDTEGNVFSLKASLSGSYTCLVFFSDDNNDKINSHLKDLNQGFSDNASGLPVKILGICPERPNHLKTLKDKLKLNFPLLSDPKLIVSDKYYVTNTHNARPSVYFSIFVIDDLGVIRNRSSEVQPLSKFIIEELKADIAKLI
jgi:peroxiredoxin